MEWRPEARFWVQSTQKRANFGFKVLCSAQWIWSGYFVDYRNKVYPYSMMNIETASQEPKNIFLLSSVQVIKFSP